MTSRKNRCFRPRRGCAYLGGWWSDTPVEVTLFCFKKKEKILKKRKICSKEKKNLQRLV
jgi:hypothetical protein